MTQVVLRRQEDLSQTATASALSPREQGTLTGTASPLSLRSRLASLISSAFTLDDAHAYLARLEVSFPEWFQRCDSTLSHSLSCERSELLEAMASAPDPFLKGMLYAAHLTSLQIEQVTGRSRPA